MHLAHLCSCLMLCVQPERLCYCLWPQGSWQADGSHLHRWYSQVSAVQCTAADCLTAAAAAAIAHDNTITLHDAKVEAIWLERAL